MLALPICRLAVNRWQSQERLISFWCFKGPKMQKPEIQSIDHIVMQAADLAATIKFYTEILGMEHSSVQPLTGGGGTPVFAFRIAKDQFA
jgi:4-hydroxyphenylpyruvate dioxygenase-like putative hemolysin